MADELDTYKTKEIDKLNNRYLQDVDSYKMEYSNVITTIYKMIETRCVFPNKQQNVANRSINEVKPVNSVTLVKKLGRQYNKYGTTNADNKTISTYDTKNKYYNDLLEKYTDILEEKMLVLKNTLQQNISKITNLQSIPDIDI